MMEKPTKTGELRLGLLKVGHGAPGKRKSDSGHVVVRFADGLDRFGNAGQIVNRDAARFAAGLAPAAGCRRPCGSRKDKCSTGQTSTDGGKGQIIASVVPSVPTIAANVGVKCNGV